MDITNGFAVVGQNELLQTCNLVGIFVDVDDARIAAATKYDYSEPDTNVVQFVDLVGFGDSANLDGFAVYDCVDTVGVRVIAVYASEEDAKSRAASNVYEAKVMPVTIDRGNHKTFDYANGENGQACCGDIVEVFNREEEY